MKLNLKSDLVIVCLMASFVFLACNNTNYKHYFDNQIQEEENGIIEPIVYIVGCEKNDKGINVAKLWKNGIGKNLTDGTYNAIARSVFVDGNDVYVVGEEKRVAVLWKNGIKQELTDGRANSIFVSSGRKN